MFAALRECLCLTPFLSRLLPPNAAKLFFLTKKSAREQAAVAGS